MMTINNSDRGRHAFTKLAVSVFAALSLCVSTASAQTYIFGRADFSVANNPVSVATGDFNGDGKLDLVVTADNTVSVLLGQVDGTFSSHVDYPTGTFPASAATGDFNGDGNLDFVVANENCVLAGRAPGQSLSCGAGTLSIFLGNGDGTFQPKVDYSTGTGPAAVVVGDFNGDSKLDLAVANLADGTVSIFLGNGDGTFRNQIVYPAVSNQGIAQLQGSLVVADFNGDHKLDLAVGLGAVAILLGNGDGTFQQPLDVSLPAVAAGSLAKGDFNNDGKLDLAVGALQGLGSVSIFLGNGDGTFILQGSYSQVGPTVVAVDLNGDGKLDLAMLGIGPGQANAIAILLGNGDGTFRTGVFYGTGASPAGLAAADFNGDGKVDLAVTDAGSSSVSILLGLGDGRFVGKTDYPVGEADSLTTADFNNDGKLDLAASNFGGEVSVLLGNGNGTFQPAASFLAGPQPLGVAAGDFNRDGNADLAVANGSCTSFPCAPGSVSILLGNGGGTFQSAVNYTLGPQPVAVAVGDFNGDGKLDLAVTNYGMGAGSSISILLGNGDGTFRTRVDYATPAGPYSIVTGDFKGDGKLDLVITTNSNVVSVLLGNGDGTFQSHVDYPVPLASTSSIVIADYNGDGKLDFAAGSSILLGNGDGTFRLSGGFTASSGPLSVGDFNGDGKLDLVAGTMFGSSTSIQLGNGDGTFRSPVDYLLTNETTASVVVHDFNGDGIPDLAGADSNASTVSVMLSTAFKAVSPTSLNFGSQGVGTTSSAQTIKISNPSNVPFDISSIAASTTFAESNDCGANLAPGANCTVGVSFSPTMTGLDSGTITITDSTRSSPQVILLTGTGVNGPFLTAFPGRMIFGPEPVGTSSAASTIRLVNTGNAALTLTGVSVTGANSSDFRETSHCGSSLPAGGSCTVDATFTPSAGGVRTANLSIADTAPGSPQLVALVGAGGAPIATLSPTSLIFSAQTVGTSSAPQTVTLTNTGSGPLNITQISATGDFSQTNTCSTSLAVGSACQISVTFTPTTAGNRTSIVTIADNASGSPQTVALLGTGSTSSLSLGVAPGSSSTVTVSAGQTASYTLAIGGGGFSGTASLSCTGAPKGATCSVPVSVNVNASTASTFTVSVTTTSRTLAASHSDTLLFPGWWAMATFGFVLLPGVGRRGRSALRLPPLALLLLICSCGGSSPSPGPGPNPNPNGTPAGTYTLTVSATSVSTNQSIPLTLKVQ
jgi:hypothetical protein